MSEPQDICYCRKNPCICLQHDVQCEAELTSHGYTPCRCAERAQAVVPRDPLPPAPEIRHVAERIRTQLVQADRYTASTIELDELLVREIGDLVALSTVDVQNENIRLRHELREVTERADASYAQLRGTGFVPYLDRMKELVVRAETAETRLNRVTADLTETQQQLEEERETFRSFMEHHEATERSLDASEARLAAVQQLIELMSKYRDPWGTTTHWRDQLRVAAGAIPQPETETERKEVKASSE